MRQDNVHIKMFHERVIAQAVSRQLPTATTWVRAQFKSYGICGGLIRIGQIISEYFFSPCQFLICRLLHTHHRLSSGVSTADQIVANVPSGLNLTPPQETKIKTRVHKHLICEL
jgi:hypothetical protein